MQFLARTDVMLTISTRGRDLHTWWNSGIERPKSISREEMVLLDNDRVISWLVITLSFTDVNANTICCLNVLDLVIF